MILDKAQAQSTSLTPGAILPIMTSAQRTAFASPLNGMLVFDTGTQSYWFRQSGIWVELPKGGSSSNYWQLTGSGGNEIKNTNSGGFWSANPTGLTAVADNTSNPPTVPVSGAGTRLMWIPNRSAFRVGTVSSDNASSWSANNVGLFSFGAGFDPLASGKYSVSMGYAAEATGAFSVSIGTVSLARGANSIAMGYTTQAIGQYSTTIGFGASALGDYATALGNYTEANGSSSTALGRYSKAIGDNSFASGYFSTANGGSATASGYTSIAGGFGSVALGNYATASGHYSTASGDHSTASGVASTAFGQGTFATGDYSTALGLQTTAGGNAATAIGYSVTASGSTATAIGYSATASGDNSIALGSYVNTNGHRGALVIGDGDPHGDGTTYSGYNNEFVARFDNGYYFMTGSNATPRSGVYMGHGQSAWNSISDSTRKEKIVLADGEAFLLKLRNLRLGSWNYKKQGAKPERFYGPMAQDIFAAFGKDKYGTIGTDTTVSTLNMDGLLFIFSQALEKRTQDLKLENQQLKNRLVTETQELKAIIEKLDARLMNMEAILQEKNQNKLSTQAD
jgi:hypothetical protein